MKSNYIPATLTKKECQNINLQRKFLENIYQKEKFTSMDDFYLLSKQKITNYGGKFLLSKYSNDFDQIYLQSFPNFPWNFANRRQRITFTYLSDQQQFIDDLYYKLKLNSLDDWLLVQRSIFIDQGARSILTKYFKNDIKILLKKIYPNFPWEFYAFGNEIKYFTTNIENQRKFLDHLFIKFNLKSMKDWLKISKEKIMNENGGKFLLSLYSKDLKILFATIYPHYENLFIIKKNSVKSSNDRLNLINQIGKKLNLENLDDWLFVSNQSFSKFGGKYLLQSYYENDLQILLQTNFPDHHWKFYFIIGDEIEFFKSIENQKKYLDYLGKKLNINEVIDWINKEKEFRLLIEKYNGNRLLEIYDHDVKKLISTVYSMKFYRNFKHNLNEPLKLIENENYFEIEKQRNLLDSFYHKYRMKDLDQMIFYYKYKLIKKKSFRKILKIYSNEVKKCLSTIYPSHKWNFDFLDDPKKYFQSMENQMKFLLFAKKKFQILKRSDWFSIDQKEFMLIGGSHLLEIYNFDFPFLIQTIFPKKDKKILPIVENTRRNLIYKKDQILVMDHLFRELNMQTLDDWMKISENKFLEITGLNNLLNNYYNRSMKNLLSAIYKNYPWEFSKFDYEKIIEKQRKQMDRLAIKLKLKRKKDWEKVPIWKLHNYGYSDLALFYSNNILNLLKTIYPNIKWNVKNNGEIIERKNFKTILEHRSFMDQLYYTCRLKSFDDWILIDRKTIDEQGGKTLLLFHYQNNLKKLLSKVYPNYPWKFDHNLDHDLDRYSIIHKHRRMMDRLYKELNFSSMDDWLDVRKTKVTKMAFGRLLRYYHFDMKKLLLTIYPTHNWNFNQLKFVPFSGYTLSKEYLKEKIIYLKEKFQVKRKEDWYRINQNSEIKMEKALKIVYPDIVWNLHFFKSRGKKSNQRHLFVYLERIYRAYILMENYRHPHVIGENDRPLEFDIYIPALNLAFEYQGQQHYDDIPGAFAHTEMIQNNDTLKTSLAIMLGVNLINIPFWWDHSLSALFATIRYFMCQFYLRK